MSEQELITLLKSSRENNIKLNITGLLLYCDCTIIQYLEGDKSIVEKLFATINQDKRHYSIILIHTELTNHRDFPDWSMGFKRMTKNTLECTIPGFNQLAEIEKLSSSEFKNISTEIQLFIKNFSFSASTEKI
ncbi:BLUF domain-containing protein [Zooshikella sp. WH53]|uniref:BLUF domain-containing protein n=2 Tax=Zooshikella harenae TaxID=2827238 RepID=A0ABS5ZAD4_9GAMM|nr:BLUF domain-containing protein [Zooshikella harenae]